VADKIDVKALRRPDAFQSAGGKVRDWLIAQGNVLAVIAGVLLIVVLSLLLWNHFHQRNEAKAELALGKALQVLERPVGAGASEEAAPGQPAAFPSQRAKDEAVVQELTAFRSSKGGLRAARTAALPLAQAELRLGNAKDALPLLQDFTHGTSQESPFRVLSLESEGYAHEAKGEYDQALAAFERMSTENKTEFLAGMGLYHRGRMLLLQGKKSEAAQAFAEVPVLAPGSAGARLAAERSAELAQQGITAAPPALPPAITADAGSVP
jgi:predicted negative regulator of RcsB-dependent stress response